MSLYANEKVETSSLYDHDTGQVLKESEEALRSASELEDIERGHAYEQMIKTQGWHQLESWLDLQVERHKEAILQSVDQHQILRLQEAAKAFRNIKNIVHGTIRVGKSLQRDPDKG